MEIQVAGVCQYLLVDTEAAVLAETVWSYMQQLFAIRWIQGLQILAETVGGGLCFSWLAKSAGGSGGYRFLAEPVAGGPRWVQPLQDLPGTVGGNLCCSCLQNPSSGSTACRFGQRMWVEFCALAFWQNLQVDATTTGSTKDHELRSVLQWSAKTIRWKQGLQVLCQKTTAQTSTQSLPPAVYAGWCPIYTFWQTASEQTSTSSLCPNLQMLYPPEISDRNLQPAPPTASASNRQPLPPPANSARK